MANIRQIDIVLLSAFDALYDERSVTRAARRLALTQPTVSGMLNRLRGVFDDPLFIRVQRGILPTPRAEALAEPVKALLADAEALLAPEQFDPAETDRTFSFMGHDYLRYMFVPKLAAALRRAAPLSRLAVMPAYVNDLAEKLGNGALDLAVTVARHVPPNQRTRPLFLDHHVGVVRKSHPMKEEPDIETFCALDHAIVSPAGGGFSGPTDAALHERGLGRRVVASFPDYRLLVEALEDNDLAAVVPESLARKHERSGVRVFRLPVSIPALKVTACWHPRVDKDAAEIWFRELVFDIADEVQPIV